MKTSKVLSISLVCIFLLVECKESASTEVIPQRTNALITITYIPPINQGWEDFASVYWKPNQITPQGVPKGTSSGRTIISAEKGNTITAICYGSIYQGSVLRRFGYQESFIATKDTVWVFIPDMKKAIW